MSFLSIFTYTLMSYFYMLVRYLFCLSCYYSNHMLIIISALQKLACGDGFGSKAFVHYYEAFTTMRLLTEVSL